MDKLYLDAAASTRPFKAVIDLASQVSLVDFANPGAIHGFGDSCNRIVEEARRQILTTLMGDRAKDFACIFTSGATESNNLAILGAARAKAKFSKTVITTTAEHDSVSRVCDLLANEGFQIVRLRVGPDGQIDWNEFASLLKSPVALVTALAVSNQNGAILPVEKMVDMVRELSPRTVFHTDATQAIGKVRLDWSRFDLVSFSGHKVGGLRGSGALLKRKKIQLVPPEVGGGQEFGLRSGTLNTPGDAALGLAVEQCLSTLDARVARAEKFKETLLAGLQGVAGVAVLSPASASPFVIALGLERWKASTVVQYLSTQGIYISTTSACDAKSDAPNAILRSMGFAPHLADNPLRISISGESETPADATRFVEALKVALKTIRPDR